MRGALHDDGSTARQEHCMTGGLSVMGALRDRSTARWEHCMMGGLSVMGALHDGRTQCYGSTA